MTYLSQLPILKPRTVKDGVVIFPRLPYQQYESSLDGYKLKDGDLKIYISSGCADEGISDWFWGTSLNDVVVRGTICLIDMLFDGNDFLEKYFGSIGIDYDADDSGSWFDDYAALCRDAIWNDIEIQTGHSRKDFEYIKTNNKKFNYKPYLEIYNEIYKISDMDEDIEKIIDKICELEIKDISNLNCKIPLKELEKLENIVNSLEYYDNKKEINAIKKQITNLKRNFIFVEDSDDD